MSETDEASYAIYQTHPMSSHPPSIAGKDEYYREIISKSRRNTSPISSLFHKLSFREDDPTEEKRQVSAVLPVLYAETRVPKTARNSFAIPEPSAQSPNILSNVQLEQALIKAMMNSTISMLDEEDEIDDSLDLIDDEVQEETIPTQSNSNPYESTANDVVDSRSEARSDSSKYEESDQKYKQLWDQIQDQEKKIQQPTQEPLEHESTHAEMFNDQNEELAKWYQYLLNRKHDRDSAASSSISLEAPPFPPTEEATPRASTTAPPGRVALNSSLSFSEAPEYFPSHSENLSYYRQCQSEHRPRPSIRETRKSVVLNPPPTPQKIVKKQEFHQALRGGGGGSPYSRVKKYVHPKVATETAKNVGSISWIPNGTNRGRSPARKKKNQKERLLSQPDVFPVNMSDTAKHKLRRRSMVPLDPPSPIPKEIIRVRARSTIQQPQKRSTFKGVPLSAAKPGRSTVSILTLDNVGTRASCPVHLLDKPLVEDYSYVSARVFDNVVFDAEDSRTLPIMKPSFWSHQD